MTTSPSSNNKANNQDSGQANKPVVRAAKGTIHKACNNKRPVIGSSAGAHAIPWSESLYPPNTAAAPTKSHREQMQPLYKTLVPHNDSAAAADQANEQFRLRQPVIAEGNHQQHDKGNREQMQPLYKTLQVTASSNHRGATLFGSSSHPLAHYTASQQQQHYRPGGGGMAGALNHQATAARHHRPQPPGGGGKHLQPGGCDLSKIPRVLRGGYVVDTNQLLGKGSYGVVYAGNCWSHVGFYRYQFFVPVMLQPMPVLIYKIGLL